MALFPEAEQTLWLLSDWYKQLLAVAVEVLRRRLYRYGIQQIAIFANACRSLPRDIAVADLTADGVLGRGAEKPTDLAIDKFIAAQDGTDAYMVPGKSPEENRCMFSGVLVEGLWGTNRKPFPNFLTNKITSRSLAPRGSEKLRNVTNISWSQASARHFGKRRHLFR